MTKQERILWADVEPHFRHRSVRTWGEPVPDERRCQYSTAGGWGGARYRCENAAMQGQIACTSHRDVSDEKAAAYAEKTRISRAVQSLKRSGGRANALHTSAYLRWFRGRTEDDFRGFRNVGPKMLATLVEMRDAWSDERLLNTFLWLNRSPRLNPEAYAERFFAARPDVLAVIGG